VLVQGSGFDPLTAIDVYFDSTILTSTTTDKNGSFGNGVITATGATFTRLQVPASALPGEHTITAQERVGQKSAQKSFLVRTDWPQFGFDTGHSGYNPYENVLNPNTVGGLALRWNATFWGSDPVVANGKVYAGSGDTGDYIWALDAGTGEVLWTYPTDGSAWHTPAVANGVVYAADAVAFYALDAGSGALLWKFKPPEYYPENSPVVSEGSVYLTNDAGTIYALSAATGALLWQSATGIYQLHQPAVANHVLYTYSESGNLYALNAGTGAVIWQYATGSRHMSSPSVVNGRLYIESGDTGCLYALDASTGTPIWQFQDGFDYVVGSTPSVANGVVYGLVSDGYSDAIDAVDANTGTLIWQAYTGPSWGGGSMTLANGVLYVDPHDYTLRALDAATGMSLWTYSLPDSSDGSPAIADGRVYVAGSFAGLYAFSLPSQQKSEKVSPTQHPDATLPTPAGSLQPTTRQH
jgi:outer membrane protein assembly factor BamB